MPPIPRKVFITGATGYMGRRLIPMLLERGHSVTALARPGSQSKLGFSGKGEAAGLRIAPGNALDGASLRAALGDCDTWVQLIGTPHPSPAKAAQFQAVDRQAVIASVEALPGSSIKHYVYLSVAHPAPAMHAYVKVREEGEARLEATGLKVTCMRPWYVLGPGHRWPYVLIPFYKLMEAIPATREGALRLGLVTLPQMIRALVRAVENPPETVRIVPVPEIRRARL